MLMFPLPRAAFADGLRIAAFDWDLGENRRVTETGGGELLVSDLGPRLWSGSITIAANTHDGARRAQALAHALREGAASFLIGDPKGRRPASDPTGALLGAAAVSLYAHTPGSMDLTLAGLPAGFVLTPGDYLSFTYGSPARYALHQVVVGGAAGLDGRRALTVVPRVRVGAVNGAAVSLVSASCKAIVVPGSFKSGTIGLAATAGFAFDFRQTLR